MERSLHPDFIAYYITSILEMRLFALARGTIGSGGLYRVAVLGALVL